MLKTWVEMRYFTLDVVKGLRPYDLSVKYYVYIFIHLCDNLRIFSICNLYYDVQLFCFRGCRLSSERVVTHSLHLSLFPLGVKVLDIIELVTAMYSFR